MGYEELPGASLARTPSAEPLNAMLESQLSLPHTVEGKSYPGPDSGLGEYPKRERESECPSWMRQEGP